MTFFAISVTRGTDDEYKRTEHRVILNGEKNDTKLEVVGIERNGMGGNDGTSSHLVHGTLSVYFKEEGRFSR